MEFGLWHGILAVAIFVLGGIIKLLYDLFKALDKRDRLLAEKEAAFEKHVAENYITLEDFNRKGDILRNEFAILNARLEEVRKGKYQS